MHPILSFVRERPAAAAGIGTVIGYVLVIGTFLDLIPVYPEIGLRTSTRLSDAIAAINAATILSLLAGWRWIRQGRVRRHRFAMTTAFSLILLFLVLYLVRVGGGGTKHFVGPDVVATAYLVMLGVHVLLSVLAVPLVLYALLLGLTHAPAELRDTPHARIGRVAAGAWTISLFLGLVTYVMLEHLYAWEYVVG